MVRRDAFGVVIGHAQRVVNNNKSEYEKILGGASVGGRCRTGAVCLFPLLLRLRRGREERRAELCRLQGGAVQNL